MPSRRQTKHTLPRREKLESPREEPASKLGGDLCQKCEEFFSEKKKLDGLGKSDEHSHHDIPQLQRSSQTCQFCKLLWKCLESSKEYGETFEQKRAGEYRSTIEIQTPGKDLEVYDMLVGFSGKSWMPSIKILIKLILVGGRYQRIVCCNNTENDTSSDMSLKQAKSWLESCCNVNDDRHSACRISRWISSPRLPTRLIDLGDRYLVRKSEGLASSTLYVTLSHRWPIPPNNEGQKDFKKPLCLNQKTYSQFTNVGIPLDDELPLTYREAFSFTKRLGIRYIWIDSLCIIQDSVEDWTREANTMWQVYSYSYCNLAAPAPALPGDKCGGLYRRSTTRACTVDATWDGLAKGVYYCMNNEEWNRDVMDAPLNKRGWVFQERLLAPRILHFGDYQLYWECNSFAASEACPGGLPKSMKNVLAKSQWNLWDRPHRSAKHYQNEEYQDYHDAWKKCITEYSKTELTRPTDKLIALSGMAKLMNDRLEGKDIYLAGMWKSRLREYLLWQSDGMVEYGMLKLKKRDLHGAPSWSWASIDSEITFRHIAIERLTFHATILDAKTTPYGSPLGQGSSFGRIKDGWIRLRGPLFRLHIGPDLKAISEGWRRGSYRAYDITLNGLYSTISRLPKDFSGSLSIYITPDEAITRKDAKGSLYIYMTPDEAITKEDAKGIDLYGMVFYVSETYYISGLLLSAAKSPDTNGTKRARKGEFTRIGRFELGGCPEFRKLLESKRKINDSELDFEEDHGDGTYTIILN